jgi:cytochrome P450
MWLNNRTLAAFLTPFITRCLDGSAEQERTKTITQLAANAYSEEVKSSAASNAAFIESTIAQMKIFMFAGHDTTASLMCFVYHLLSTHPDKLAILRAEHDAILGTEASLAKDIISESPFLLNQMHYTTAVIKETLRLFPPVGTARRGKPGFFLTQPETGLRYPTEGFMLFGCSIAVQRDPQFWPEPDAFIPERWIVPETDPLHPRKNAWRPFELGPRNCIGQELALTEVRAALAMTVRELDIDSVYEEGSVKVLGDVAFQLMGPNDITGKPNLGMPVKVKLRKQ